LEILIGLDSNILAYALDPAFPEHEAAKRAILGADSWYVNPTVVHEVYHALVFKRKKEPVSAKRKLVEFLADRRTLFMNQTKLVSVFRWAWRADLILAAGIHLSSGATSTRKQPKS